MQRRLGFLLPVAMVARPHQARRLSTNAPPPPTSTSGVSNSSATSSSSPSSPSDVAAVPANTAAAVAAGKALTYKRKRQTQVDRQGGGPHARQTATPGKTKRTVAGGDAGAGIGGKEIRVRKRDPWGIQQLRDSWSEDAMTKRETENLSERIHREYRYHPDEQRRYYIKYTALLTVPLIVLSWGCSYYYFTGKPPWQADPQHLLNLIRAADTSPRSKLYLYRLDEMDELPQHLLRYREAHKGEKERAERVFKVTHSAFARPSEDDLRRMMAEDEEEEEMDADDADVEEDEGGKTNTKQPGRASSAGAEVVGGVSSAPAVSLV